MAGLDTEAIRQAVAMEREALEGIWDRDDVRVLWPKVALRLAERVEWLEREMADCTRDCRKAGERFEKALDLLCDVAAFFDNSQGGMTAEEVQEMRTKVWAYLDSE